MHVPICKSAYIISHKKWITIDYLPVNSIKFWKKGCIHSDYVTRYTELLTFYHYMIYLTDYNSLVIWHKLTTNEAN